MLLYFKKVTLNDLEFSKWSKVYRKSKIAIAVIGGVLSFRLFRLFYGGLFGLDIFMARFENPRKALIKIQRILALLSLTLVYIPLCIASIFVFINVSWGYQSLVTAIEAFILYAIFLALHILELKYDSSPMSDKEYLQIGLKKYGEDITMAGVPFNYNDNLREREEEKDYDTDKKAMYRLIQSVQEYNKYGFFSNENTNRFKVKKKMRRAFSDKNLAVIQEEENEDDQKTESRGESDEEEEDYMKPFAFMKHPRRPRRFSIGTEKHLEQYADKKFFSRIADIRSGKYLPNNVYAESQPPRQYSKTARLFNVDRVTQTDDNDLKLLWKLSRMIPPFKLADILGEFEMDSNGMFIIVRDEGKLKDKHGRLVNSRGYLVDEEGNVVHQNGTKIFNKDELDENNEIPAPFLLEENEFDILAQPGSLIHNEKKVGKPPKATVRKNFKKKFDDRKSSARSRGFMSDKNATGSIMTDYPRNDYKQSTRKHTKEEKIRPITSDTKRPATTKKGDQRQKPMIGNFTEGKTLQVNEEASSDFESAFGLEKIPIRAKRQNYLNETKDVDMDSELRDTKDKFSDGFFKDYLLNQRPEYYGDTSDLISRSRKLYY